MNYILIAVVLGLLMFVCRSDRRMVVVLLSWACTLFIVLIVNEFALWYIALLVDFGVYSLVYGSEHDDSKKEEDEEEEEEQNKELEGEGEEEEAYGAGSLNDQELDPAMKSQPVTFRDSAKRASVLLDKLQL